MQVRKRPSTLSLKLKVGDHAITYYKSHDSNILVHYAKVQRNRGRCTPMDSSWVVELRRALSVL